MWEDVWWRSSCWVRRAIAKNIWETNVLLYRVMYRLIDITNTKRSDHVNGSDS